MWHWSHMGGWWWLAIPMMIMFWTLLVWLGYVLVRNSTRSSRTTAEEVLAERFARGELDESESAAVGT